MATVGPSIPVYKWYPDAQPSAVGVLVTGKTVTIELWKDGVAVSITSNACVEIGDTGKYTWSIANLPKLTKSREQYHWRMTSEDNDTDEGDFIVEAIEGVAEMPSLNNPSSYIVTH